MLALLLLLGGAALLSAQPWATTTAVPHLSVSPGLGVALGDSIVAAPAPSGGVADARVAEVLQTTLAAMPSGGTADGSGPAQEMGISPARPVADLEGGNPVGEPPEPPAPKPPSQPQAPPPPPPAAVPVAAAAPPPGPVPAPPTRTAASPGSGPQGPLGAGVEGGPPGVIQVRDGDEHALSFSLYTDGTAYEAPGVENLIVRFTSAAGGQPSFGLQLWDDGSGDAGGLWSSGDAMGGERFLAPVVEGEPHEVVVYFMASSKADGFYLLFLDGQLIDARTGVSLIDPGSSSAQIDVGLFRGGEQAFEIPGLRLGPAELSDTLESVPALP